MCGIDAMWGWLVSWLVVTFPLGVAQGYVDYGRWPIGVMLCVGVCGVGVLLRFPWALPRATLTIDRKSTRLNSSHT